VQTSNTGNNGAGTMLASSEAFYDLAAGSHTIKMKYVFNKVAPRTDAGTVSRCVMGASWVAMSNGMSPNQNSDLVVSRASDWIG
jgi:hypothetical protein